MRFTRIITTLLVIAGLLVTPPMAEAANQTFSGVHYLVSTRKKAKEVKARLIFTEDSLEVYGERKAALTDAEIEVRRYLGLRPTKEIPYSDLKAVTYSNSKHPRWKLGLVAAAALGVFALPIFFTKGKKHWLTVQADGDHVALRLSKKNYALILAAMEEQTGLDVGRRSGNILAAMEGQTGLDVGRRPRNALEDINRVGFRNVTGILNLYSLRQEMQLGRQTSNYVNKQSKIVDDPVIGEYVNRIGQNLARNSDVKVPPVIKVIHDETINAFVLPGGFLYVNSGLIQFARNEAELAGVLGHEIAHIAGRHVTRQLSRTQLIATTADALIEGFGGNNWGTLIAVNAANVALPLTFLKFSRIFETKADFLGMQYLYKTGYDPLAMVSFFERLQARARTGQGSIAAVFSSHPLDRKRAANVQKAINELLSDQPAYAISSSEFEAIKARITKLHGGITENPEHSEQPEILRR